MSYPQIGVDKIFAETFSAFGPPFEGTALFEREATGLKEVRAFLRQAMSLQWRAYGESGLIHLDYIDNTSFNAVATRTESHELIGIFSGAVHFIYRFWFFFMCDPLAMPAVGDPSKDYPSPTVAASIRNEDLDINGYQHPRDETRYGAAQNLALATCLLLVNHEVGHIASCHPHYLEEASQERAVYEELPVASMAADEQLLRRGMELEADEYAGGITFQCLHANKSLMQGVRDLDMGYVWSAASMALFLLIHKHSGGGFYAESPTHPAPFDRWMLSLEALLKSERCQVFNPDITLIGAASRQVLEFWFRHGFLEGASTVQSQPGDGVAAEPDLRPSLFGENLPAAEARINIALQGIRKVRDALNRLGAERAAAGAQWHDRHRGAAHSELARQLSDGSARRKGKD